MRSARGWHEVCPRLARGLPKVGTRSAQGWHEVCPRLAQGLPEVGTRSAQGWHEVGMRFDLIPKQNLIGYFPITPFQMPNFNQSLFS